MKEEEEKRGDCYQEKIVRPKCDKPLKSLSSCIISFSDLSDYHTDTGWRAEKHNKDSYFIAL